MQLGILDELEKLICKTYGLKHIQIEDLGDIANSFGVDEKTLSNDIKALILQRILFWLIEEPRRDLNIIERKNFIKKRLQKIMLPSVLESNNFSDSFFETLATIQSRFSYCKSISRSGINNIEESLVSRLNRENNFRCCVCGVPLHSSESKVCNLFTSGVEPVSKAHLDHQFPFYLTGNSTPYELICEDCNLLKREKIGVQEDGFVIAGNHLKRGNSDESNVSRRMAFWTLYQSRSCMFPGCETSSNKSILFVRPRLGSLFTYGNLIVTCALHSNNTSKWIHDDDWWGAKH